MYEKVDALVAITKYRVSPIDTHWIGTYKFFEEESVHVGSRIAARDINNFVCSDPFGRH